MTLPILRPYQSDFVDQLRAEMSELKRVIACSPTGSGKSTIAKFIFGMINKREPADGQSGYSVIAVHRRGLVDNIADTFERKPKLPYGMIMSRRKTDWGKRVQVSSIDTLLAWYVDGEYTSSATFDFVAFDEAHSHSSKLKKFLDAHDAKRKQLGLKPAFVLGLTATPQAEGLSQVYRKIVKGPSVKWLIENDYLVPFRYFQAKVLGDLSKLVKSGERFTDKSLDAAFKGLAGNLIEDWKCKSEGRQTVGFFSRLSHAQEACDSLNAAGISARYVDGKTSDEDRKRLFDGLQNRDYQYLCNVGIVDRGTDIPAIGCIQLCTAIGSVPRLIQILGRGARPDKGKKDCICIDHGGSISRLNAFFEDDIEWTLEAEREKQLNHEGKPVISCPQCGCQYRGGTCRSCGYEPTFRERKSQGLEFVAGELVEIRKKETNKKKTCEQLIIEALYRAGRTDRTWKQAWGIAKREADKQGIQLRVPREFRLGQRTLLSVPYGHPDSDRKVKDLYDGIFA
jgi:DNA repair protein RadD